MPVPGHPQILRSRSFQLATTRHIEKTTPDSIPQQRNRNACGPCKVIVRVGFGNASTNLALRGMRMQPALATEGRQRHPQKQSCPLREIWHDC